MGDAAVTRLDKATSIAIIGGGFSGAALAAHLLRCGGPDLRIDLVDPRQVLGGGIAHSDASPNHILNVTADRMSLWSDQPYSFLDWARRHGPSLGWKQAGSARDQTYLPRRLFAHYVGDELSKAVTLGQPIFKHHQATADSLQISANRFQVGLSGSETITADRVVLATGFRPPAIPFPVVGGGLRFIADPWKPGALDQVKPFDDVLLIGTGLTMVDMVYDLDQANHKGRVTALSRHGFLPRIHDNSDKQAPVIGVEDAAKGVVHTLRKLREALASGRCDWRTAVDALRPIVDELWQAMPPVEQDRFMRHMRPLWEVHRHRMPSDSADLLLKRLGQGRLDVVAGRVEQLSADESGVEAVIRHRHAKSSVVRKFQWVVNCTPPAPPLAPGADALTSSLVGSGLVRGHRSGMGFDVDASGRALSENGEPIPGLYVLGPPRRGHAIEATAVPHIRLQLDALIRTLRNDR